MLFLIEASAASIYGKDVDYDSFNNHCMISASAASIV